MIFEETVVMTFLTNKILNKDLELSLGAAENTITPFNWGYPPFNRKSFQHMQSLFPTARIRRDANNMPNIRQDRQDVLSMEFIGLDGKAAGTYGDLIENTHTDALLVMHDGVCVVEHYTNGMNKDSLHLVNSITKTFIGMLAGILIDEGVLDSEQLISKLVPELAGTDAWERTTLRHCLDMTAGVEYVEDYGDRNCHFWKETATVGWRPKLAEEQKADTLIEFAAECKVGNIENGVAYNYKTVLTNVIGMAIERAADVPLADLLSRKIWSKLPMHHDANIVIDSNQFPYAGAGMSACARDLLQFGQMMISDGVSNGKQVIPKGWIDDTRKGSSESKKQFSDGQYGSLLTDWHYRNQVWTMPGSSPAMLAIGIHGQLIMMDKANKTVIVKLASQPRSVDFELDVLTLNAFGQLAIRLNS